MLGLTALTFGAGAASYQYLWRQKEMASGASCPIRRSPRARERAHAPGLSAMVQQDAVGTPLIGGAFTLVDDDGKVVTDKDFLGEYMLVYFGFTYCPDICPSELVKMERVVSALGGSRAAPPRLPGDPRPPTSAPRRSRQTRRRTWGPWCGPS